MTNKERYKQAFSALQTSVELSKPIFSMEGEEIMEIQKRHKKNIAVAAAVVCAIVIGGSGTAYAADIGGIQQKVYVWLHGDRTEAEVQGNGDGGYTIRYNQDGEDQEMGFGGVSIGEDGNETWLSADELLEDMNASADVEADENGKIWVYYYDQKIDITDLFDEEGICRIVVTHEGKDRYLEIEREDGGFHSTQMDSPEGDAEQYMRITP